MNLVGLVICGFKKEAWCHRALVASSGSRILALAEGQRHGEIGFGRFLQNPSVTVAQFCADAARRTSEVLVGRDILTTQDTSVIVLQAKIVRYRGYGTVGKDSVLLPLDHDLWSAILTAQMSSMQLALPLDHDLWSAILEAMFIKCGALLPLDHDLWSAILAGLRMCVRVSCRWTTISGLLF